MPSGIKIKEITIGNGAVADRDKVVLVHLRGFLHRGEECLNTYTGGQPERIDLSKRESIAGLRKGIVGMRVGGQRQLVISPHLAYGELGVPGRIPSQALLRFEVDLLAVREVGEFHPEDFPPGRQLFVCHPGAAKRNLPGWQFLVREGGPAGFVVTFPLPGGSWRHARWQQGEAVFDQSEIKEIIASAQSTLAGHPGEFLHHEVLLPETATFEPDHQRLPGCEDAFVSVMLSERGVPLGCHHFPENDQILRGSRFYQVIALALAPYLGPAGTATTVSAH